MKGYVESDVLDRLRRSQGAMVSEATIELRQQPGIRVWGMLDFLRQQGWTVKIGSKP